jgi:hypothetical protein
MRILAGHCKPSLGVPMPDQNGLGSIHEQTRDNLGESGRARDMFSGALWEIKITHDTFVSLSRAERDVSWHQKH